MHPSFILLLLCLWGNVEVSSSQSAPRCSSHEVDVIQFTFESGYKSAQTSKHICTTESQLEVSHGKCHCPLGCGRPPPLMDGDTKETVEIRYAHNERVEYICQNLYTMQGEPFKTCHNGEWTGEMRCLKPCIVDQEAMRRNNIAFAYSYKIKLYSPHNGQMSFSCTRGRPYGRVAMRQRCIDGVMTLPTCQ